MDGWMDGAKKEGEEKREDEKKRIYLQKSRRRGKEEH